MLTDDRTGEFYAGGRLGYKTDGEPFRFDGADEAANAARERGGVALVFVPTKWENQLTDYKVIETEIIGSNGVLTLAAIRVRIVLQGQGLSLPAQDSCNSILSYRVNSAGRDKHL